MACWAHGSGDRWQRRMARMQQRMERMHAAAERWGGDGGSRAPTGNRAFDEYRAETLRRLEEEQREFMEFLNRLRHAKDKAEFDQFMAERGRRSGDTGPQPAPPSPSPGNRTSLQATQWPGRNSRSSGRSSLHL